MSKVSSVDYPSYTGSTLSLGGSQASANLLNGKVSSDYNMSDSESAIYNYALDTLANILPQLNTFSPDTLSSIQSQVDAYKNQGIQNINQTYNPMITSLENDIASRFGNLDNSIFKDNLGDIEKERANSVSSFAQNVLAKQSDLVSNELNQRYALVNLLSGLSDNIYTNALNAISTALGGSSSANTYNNNLYNSLYRQSTAGNSNSIGSALASALGLGSSSFLSYL